MTKHAKTEVLLFVSGIFLSAVLAAVTYGAVAQTTAPPVATKINGLTHNPCDVPTGLVALANGGNAKAKVKLAVCYSNLGYMNLNDIGDGTYPPDRNELAISWFKKAAALGNIDADKTLGLIYSQHDDSLSFKYYYAAALLGDLDSEYLVGIRYSVGIGVAKDEPKGAVWIQKAAEQGDLMAKKDFARFSTDMDRQLGNAYESGDGVPQDYEQAINWYRKAAAQGDPWSEEILGDLYTIGHGTDVNLAAAADWYYKAGVGFLKQHHRDDALRVAELLKTLEGQDPDLPNRFLAKQLIDKIYAPTTTTQPIPHPSPPQQPTINEGTGWPVAGGFVVTNHHVIAGADAIWIRTANGTKQQARIAADDPNNDLVLLKVENPADLPPALPLASGPTPVGASVFALGYPEPDIMGGDVKLTSGVISAAAGAHDDPRFYQTSTEIQEGSSGSPLLNMRGQVVGIMTATLDAAKLLKLTGDLPENVNYAIKVVYLKALLQSVPPVVTVRGLPAQAASLENLDKRIAPSVIRIFARVPASKQD